MTRRIIGGPAGISTAPATQNNSSYVLIAETMPIAGTTNSFSGMSNPQMINGTGTITFANIPQTYRDLKIQLSYMSHNAMNASHYRFSWWINNDNTNNRYYSRGGTQATGTPGWNSDNTDRMYGWYSYNHLNNGQSWSSNGEILIPNYSSTLKTNFRGMYGVHWNMLNLSYPTQWGWNYYNADAVKLPVTRLDFSWESDVKFCIDSKISLYGIGAK
jgi:hypothetical protein